MSPHRTIPFTLLLLLSLCLTSACSLLYDFEVCSTNADCQKLASAGETLICQANTCVATTADTASDTSGTTDTSGDTSGTTSTATDTTADVDTTPACTQNAQCIADNSASFICVNSACIDTAQFGCKAPTYFTAERNNVVFLASIIPSTGPFLSLGVSFLNSISLAMEDFNQNATIPGRRAVGWIDCDSQGSSEQATQIARHLVNLNVPVIIGPLLSEEFISVVNTVTAQAGIMTIAPAASAPAISDLEDDNLAWRVIASDIYQGDAIANRLIELKSDPTAPISKVYIFFKDDTYGNSLFAQASPAITEAFGNTNYKARSYPDPLVLLAQGKDLTEEYGLIIQSAISEMPDAQAVVFIGTSEAIDISAGFFGGRAQIAQAGGAPIPRLIYSHGATAALPDLPAKATEAILPYVEGIAPNIFDDNNYPAYVQRYTAKFAGEAPISSSTLTYDATFVALFAMTALPANTTLTGTALRGVMPRLYDKQQGTPISFGDPATDFIKAARDELVNNKSVNLQGVSGSLDFDAHGDVLSDVISFDLTKTNDTTYSITPKRIYAIQNPTTKPYGVWADIPATP
jgi:ABC-type branched-subunit amino acid transport system substrate-binding protein